MAPRRRAAEESYGFFGCFVALSGGFRFRSIGDNRSAIGTRSTKSRGQHSCQGRRQAGGLSHGLRNDRPEAYPTGHETTCRRPIPRARKVGASTQLGRLIRQDGYGVEQMSYTNLSFLVIVNAVITLHSIVLFRALRLYRGFGSCPPHFIFRMNKLARCCRYFG